MRIKQCWSKCTFLHFLSNELVAYQTFYSDSSFATNSLSVLKPVHRHNTHCVKHTNLYTFKKTLILDIFLSAGYQRGLIHNNLYSLWRSGLQHGGTLRNPFERIWIHRSLGSIIFCSAASSHHGVGNSAEWKVFYQEADKEHANMSSPTHTQTLDVTSR